MLKKCLWKELAAMLYCIDSTPAGVKLLSQPSEEGFRFRFGYKDSMLYLLLEKVTLPVRLGGITMDCAV